MFITFLRSFLSFTDHQTVGLCLFSASGILKGYDALINLVLDNAVEYIRDSDDPQKITEVLSLLISQILNKLYDRSELNAK